jgi:tetratricopeptide (TPR) repeat protein
MAEKARSLDDQHPEIHILSGVFHLYNAEHSKAVASGQHAIALGPNNADVHAAMAHILRFSGRFEEAIAMVRKAIRLQPFYPAWFLSELALCYYYLNKFEESLETAEQYRDLAISRNETDMLYFYHSISAMNLVRLGREQEARAAAQSIYSEFPGYSLEWDKRFGLYKDKAHLERQHDDLRKAGIS